MESDFGSWFANLNTPSAPFNLGQWNTIPAYMSHCANLDSKNGTYPRFPFSGIPDSKASQPKEPQRWLNCFTHYPQTFTRVPSNVFEEKIPDGPRENLEEFVSPNKAPPQKRFLVFDQSRDQTKLIFSSGIGTPVQCLTSLGPKLDTAYGMNKSELATGRYTIHRPGLISTDDECNENHGDEAGSEMHEDTEELNALLYSDEDEEYYEDEEEASTGHSPSTMTAYDKQERFEENAEEVASSSGPTKRMKISDGGYLVPSLLDTASSVKPKRWFDDEDGAESSCADGKHQGLVEPVSLLDNKRAKKDKIRETVSVLQKIIPGGEGKDAIVVLDEAISYLRLLKRKATALGVGTL